MNQEIKSQVNMRYLLGLVANLTLGTFNVGFVISGNNQVGSILEAQFGWEHEVEAKKWNTAISSASISGLIIGSFTAGKLLSNGRRKAIILMSLIACLSIVPTLFLNIWAILIGKFIFGIASGTIIVASSIYLNETVPVEQSSKFDFTTNLGVILGITICLVAGLALPDPNVELVVAQTTQIWRLISSMPILFASMSLFNWLCFFKHEPVKFYIN